MLCFCIHLYDGFVILLFRWFTSMIGRKANLKLLISKVRAAGASVVKTTEFVQGQTARWGLAWSFIAPRPRKMVLSSSAPAKNHHSFMLQVGIISPFVPLHMFCHSN
jgi:23S rRNA (adenine1618-N6)-methyltransferase